MVQGRGLDRGGDVTPRPDPTEKTTESLLREIASLREVLEAQIRGQREVLEARIDGGDKAIKLLQAISDRQPDDVDKKIAHLQKLHEEKFHSIDVQFSERDIRVEQRATDTKTAVDAALAAQEKMAGNQYQSLTLSINKSEIATNKQIDQMGALIAANKATTDDKNNDFKGRLDRIEGTGKGRGDVWGWVVAGISALGMVISIIFALTRTT